LNTQKNKDKYTALAYPFGDWSNKIPPVYLNLSLFSNLLVEDGFYKLIYGENSEYRAEMIRHFHPNLIYFMIIYRLNYNDLTLKDFSNPFIIMKEPASSFLNFPMGLTINNENILISYGDSDCKSYVASFTKEKIIKLCKNTNDTDVSSIDFDLYDHL
jgi:hypothetical protein